MGKSIADIEYCTEFHPTIEEFNEGLFKYLSKVDELVGNEGMYKVVAPPEWNPRAEGGSYR